MTDAPHGARATAPDRALLSVHPLAAAEQLLGMRIVAQDGRRGGTIVEVEAYGGPEDRASHARSGRTTRTAPMFGPPGVAYVYLIYGIHHCLNIVAHDEGEAGAVLIRGIDPGPDHDPRAAAGPGLLARHLGVDRTASGQDLLLEAGLRLVDPGADLRAELRSHGVLRGPRIGIAGAGPEAAARPWRLGIAGRPGLSRSFPVR